MNQMTRTLLFVAVAALSVIGAVVTHSVTRPPEVQGYTDVGEDFYPGFQDPTTATAIRIAAWNPVSNRVERFEVRNTDGVWRIPSHFNYPADGEEQLATAAASAIGIQRGTLASRTRDSHAGFGVVNPDDEAAIQGVGITGTRITLYEGEEVLSDLIVGQRRGQDDPLEEATSARQDKKGLYYVRRPDEDRVYLAEVDINVSTRFSDWIERDLLDITPDQLREIVIRRYSVNEETGDIDDQGTSELKRVAAASPWKLEDLQPGESLQESVVDRMIRAIDDLSIVGVRPQPKNFTAESITQDLTSKGFYPTARGELLSNEGEFLVGTSEGLRYVLRFGEVVIGGDLEVEVGSAGRADEEASNDASEQASDEESTSDPGLPRSSRYVFVTVDFDATLLPAPPERPKKPEPPADETEAAPDETPGQETPTNDDPAASLTRKLTPQEKYQRALKEYEEELERYKTLRNDHERRVKEGQEKAERLSKRFSEWYYVIDGSTFEHLKVARSELVSGTANADSASESPPAPGESASPPDANETAPSPESSNMDEASSDANKTEDSAASPAEEAQTPPAENETDPEQSGPAS